MNIHISQDTPLQPWTGELIFDEYPLHILQHDSTVTLLFQDDEAIARLACILEQMLSEIDETEWVNLPMSSEDPPF